MTHEEYMKKALHYAKLCGKRGEIPVGCIIVRNGEIVSYGNNARQIGKNALKHAEIVAIDRACRKLGGWRLWECDMYVTLEPCIMCAGAIVNARIRNVYFGAYDAKAGCFGSVMNVNDFPFNHHPNITGGVLEEECSSLIKSFFKELRNKNKSGNGDV